MTKNREGLIKKPNQCQKILKVLEDANGDWVNGRYFLREMYLSQYHARITELRQSGYDIESSDDRDQFNFVSYRLKPKQTLF